MTINWDLLALSTLDQSNFFRRLTRNSGNALSRFFSLQHPMASHDSTPYGERKKKLPLKTIKNWIIV